MFWNKSPKLPITEDDKEWIEESLLLLEEKFGKEYFHSLETILPNKKYYDHTFTATRRFMNSLILILLTDVPY